MVQHIGNRYFKPAPGTDDIAITACRIHNMLADNTAFFRYHFPFAVRRRPDIQHAITRLHLRTEITSAFGHRTGHGVRVDMTIGKSQRARFDIADIQKWMIFFDLVGANHLHRKTNQFADTLNITKPVDFLVGERKTNTTTAVPAC